MLFTIYVIMILLLRLMGGAAYFTLIPLGLFAMLTSLLVGRRVALVMNTLFCIIGCFIFNGDVQFLMYSLLVGTLGALLSGWSGWLWRWRQSALRQCLG